jgi:hypothetical protein
LLLREKALWGGNWCSITVFPHEHVGPSWVEVLYSSGSSRGIRHIRTRSPLSYYDFFCISKMYFTLGVIVPKHVLAYSTLAGEYPIEYLDSAKILPLKVKQIFCVLELLCLLRSKVVRCGALKRIDCLSYLTKNQPAPGNYFLEHERRVTQSRQC